MNIGEIFKRFAELSLEAEEVIHEYNEGKDVPLSTIKGLNAKLQVLATVASVAAANSPAAVRKSIAVVALKLNELAAVKRAAEACG
jgi:hypothetical protein